ncbi:hypothetical protein VTI74DRAFT_5351 [Chaetomium olivicolor]
MVWRSMKRSKKAGGSGGNVRDGRGGLRLVAKGIASRIPFLRQRGWQSLDDLETSQASPPSYGEKAGNTSATAAEGFFGSEKTQAQQPLPAQQWPMLAPRAALPEQGLMPSNHTYGPPSQPGNIYSTAKLPRLVTTVNAPAYSHQPQESFSSTNAAHFGAIMMSNSPVTPVQAGISPISYQNQTLLTQQFMAPYNPIHRRPSRTLTDVSSLSSGFGDGDIMLFNSPITPPVPAAAAGAQYTTRFSWMSHPTEQTPQQPGGGTTTSPTRQNSNASSRRRETVYTETSEDQPARFRSVISWVDQQTGRIKRAQQREETGTTRATQVPGNPGIPGINNEPPGLEQRFDMMMDDEEKPRRVEEVVPGVGMGKAV